MRRRGSPDHRPAAGHAHRRGIIAMDGAGSAYLELTSSEVLRLDEADAAGALHGDEVTFATWRANGRVRGRVVAVLSRSQARLCGTIEGGRWFLPDDARYPGALEVGGAGAVDEADLCGVVVQPVDRDGPEVRLTRVFGRRGSPHVEENAILWQEDVVVDFEPAVLAEAEAVASRVLADLRHGREDLRSVGFITIDPASAEDHDDAVFVQRRGDGTTLVMVAIADVSAFVRPGSSLDRSARERGTSLYLPGRVIPMLPRRLSADAASLRRGVERPAIVLELVLEPDLSVRGTRVVPGVVTICAALTYEDVASVLGSEGRQGPPSAREQHAHLIELDGIAQRLRAARRDRGAVAIESPEIRTVRDPRSGLPSSIQRIAASPTEARAHQMIEELMLLANGAIAHHLDERREQAPFRIHDAARGPALGAVIVEAKRRGLDLDPRLALDAHALRAALARIGDEVQRRALSAAFMEAMPAAEYAETSGEHFALATGRYLHFTSPIRRYADLLVHRSLRPPAAPPGEVAGQTDQLNDRQRRARRIQREIDGLYAALLMQDQVGREYQGTVTRVGARTWHVALDEPAVVVRCAAGDARPEVGSLARVRITSVSLGMRLIEGTLLPEA